MATQLSNHNPIVVVQTLTNTTEPADAQNEKAGQTFVLGVPVQLNAGLIQEWDGATVAAGIAGITYEDAHNLASNGQGAAGPFTPIGYPGTGTTYGKVPNEPSAVNIPMGAPFVDGTIHFAKSVDVTIFRGQVDNANASGAGNITPTQADVGKQYGLTKDASGHWYVDYNKSTAGTNTVVEIVDLDPIDGSIANANVYFKFIRAASQYQ